MKNWLLPILAIAALLAIPMAPATAQEVINAPEANAYTLPAEGAVLSSQDFREQIATSIREAARDSNELNQRDKRRIERVMRGGFFGAGWRKNIVIDNVAERMMAERMIDVQPEGVSAAVDWNVILSFIRELLPIILQIISIFGG